MARTKTCQPRYFTTTVAQIGLCLLTLVIAQAQGQSTFNITDSGGASKLYVKDDGKIGIGTTTPIVQTHILEAGTAGMPGISAGIPLVVQRSEFDIHSSGIAIISGRDGNGVLNFGDIDDNVGQIFYNHGVNPVLDLMQFKVSSGVRMTIDGSGNVGIGALPDPTHKLLVNGTGYANAWNTPSNLRLKQNIATIQNALNQVMQLRGVSYQWRVNEHPELNLNTGIETGLIAQEVMAVLPDAVSDVTFRITDEEGFVESEETYLAMSYHQIIPVLIEAIKEQQAIIDSQTTELEALQPKMSAVEAALQQLGAWPPDEGNP